MQTKALRRVNTQKLVVLSLMCALAYLCVCFFRIPVVWILKFEPKDVVVTIAAFLYGPASGLLISVVVSLLEMVTISDTGWIGLLMNVLSTVSFSCTAALIYKKWHTLKGAVGGLLAGLLLMTGMMLLWNVLITPLYAGVPRDTVVGMLLPVFLPFNLIKGGINAAITLLLYKSVSRGLRAARLLPREEAAQEPSRRAGTIGILLGALFVFLSCVLAILLLQHKI